jgi:(2Fe-2S) ferredoxin
MTEPLEKLSKIADSLEIGGFHRHVLLCVGEACCDAATGNAAWVALKDELKRRNLSIAVGPQACYRTKVQCLRVCQGGPIAVVYPEGTWYAGLTADKVPQFVDEHLVHNAPIESMIFARNPLPHPSTDPAASRSHSLPPPPESA